MNNKLLLSAAFTLGVMIAAAYFGGDAFKGAQAAPANMGTAHRFDHSKVDWSAVPDAQNSTSQSVGPNDD